MHTALLLDEVELKDQPAKNVTVDQQVQAGETVHQEGVHAHYYGAATYYITLRRIDLFWILCAVKIKILDDYTMTKTICFRLLSVSRAEILQLFHKCYV